MKIKKTAITTFAVAALGVVALGASVTGASAGGWKKHHHKFFKYHTGYHYDYNYDYHCKPKFRKIWVWSDYHGRKVKRWVKVGKWCGGTYYSY